MAISIPLITTFDAKGINRAITQFKRLDGGVNKSAFVLKNLNQATNNAFRSVARVGAGVALGAGLIGKALVTQAMEAKRVTAETNAIIKATGGSARISAKGVGELSDKLSMQIGIDDELIQKTANLLLTFKQVQNVTGEGNNIFDRAVTTAQDLGSVFGSAEAGAMQLGKALSDPIAGITALRRAGINFSAQQKEQIKTLVQSGQTLEAQKLILDEVESQVGGTAEATATDFGRMQVAVENVAEQLGTLLLPYLETFANFVTTTIVPVLTEFGDIVGEEGLGGGIKFLGGEFLNFMENLEGIGLLVFALTTGFIALKVAMTAYTVATGIATIATTLFGVAWNATGIGLVISLIAGVIVILVALTIKFQAFRDFFIALWNGIVEAFQKYINVFLGIWEFLINKIIDGVNLIIRSWNRVQWGTDVSEIDEVSFAFDILGAKIDRTTEKVKYFQRTMNADAYERQNPMTPFVPPLPTLTPTGSGSKGLTEEEKRLQELIDKVIELKKQMQTYRKGLRDAFNIKLDADTSKGSVLTQTRNTLREIKEFKVNIKRLQARGVGSAILQEVADAGLFGGNTLAKDILNMSDLDFREFKAGQREIANIASQTASIVSEQAFGGQIAKADTKVVQAITINMPAGSNGDDVVKALQAYQRRRGSIPILVNGSRTV